MLRKEKPFHLYADDGFEQAYATEKAAISAAKKASKRRAGITYTIVKAGLSGLTGGGRGTAVHRFRNGTIVI